MHNHTSIQPLLLKRMRLIGGMGAMVLCLVLWGGCASKASETGTAQSVSTDLTQANMLPAAEREAMMLWCTSIMEVLAKRIDQIETLAINSTGAMQESYQKQLLALEEEQGILRGQYNQLRVAREEDWPAMLQVMRATKERVEAKLQNDLSDYSV